MARPCGRALDSRTALRPLWLPCTSQVGFSSDLGYWAIAAHIGAMFLPALVVSGGLVGWWVVGAAAAWLRTCARMLCAHCGSLDRAGACFKALPFGAMPNLQPVPAALMPPLPSAGWGPRRVRALPHGGRHGLACHVGPRGRQHRVPSTAATKGRRHQGHTRQRAGYGGRRQRPRPGCGRRPRPAPTCCACHVRHGAGGCHPRRSAWRQLGWCVGLCWGGAAARYQPRMHARTNTRTHACARRRDARAFHGRPGARGRGLGSELHCGILVSGTGIRWSA